MTYVAIEPARHAEVETARMMLEPFPSKTSEHYFRMAKNLSLIVELNAKIPCFEKVADLRVRSLEI